MINILRGFALFLKPINSLKDGYFMIKEKYYTVKQTSQLLNISTRTVYIYIKAGYLQYSKPAGFIYISEESIINFLHRKEQPAQKTKLPQKDISKQKVQSNPQ